MNLKQTKIMAKAELINEEGFKREYKIKTGEIITLILAEDYSQITFCDKDGNMLGKNRDFLFKQSDNDDYLYLLERMYTPIIKVGLGRAALEIFTEITGAIVYTQDHDGIRRDDGSHLTEDAPGFISRMQKEGLIKNNNDDFQLDDSNDYI